MSAVSNLLIYNIGTASHRLSLFSALNNEPSDPAWYGKIYAAEPNQPPGKLLIRITTGGRRFERYLSAKTPLQERLKILTKALWSGEGQVLENIGAVNVVGHRVVHGASEFARATKIDADVERSIERLSPLSHSQNTRNLAGIRCARTIFGKSVPQVAVFDTAFHRSVPNYAATYAGPYSWVKSGIRRYGFHGTSFRYASRRAEQLLHRQKDSTLRLVLCHLGRSCSLAATVGGKCVDTTMGFTPLEGISMCTASGSVDPGILIYLLQNGASAEELESILNLKSGLAGLSGLPGDTRAILLAATKGNMRAMLALDVFIHRLRAGIGGMIASLGGLDAIVFTDRIAEDEPVIRKAACEAFEFLGLELDQKQNAASPSDADIASARSKVRALIIRAREDWQIAHECAELC
jgi:acetate kinase